jgi:hypothetical protein
VAGDIVAGEVAGEVGDFKHEKEYALAESLDGEMTGEEVGNLLEKHMRMVPGGGGHALGGGGVEDLLEGAGESVLVDQNTSSEGQTASGEGGGVTQTEMDARVAMSGNAQRALTHKGGGRYAYHKGGGGHALKGGGGEGGHPLKGCAYEPGGGCSPPSFKTKTPAMLPLEEVLRLCLRTS